MNDKYDYETREKLSREFDRIAWSTFIAIVCVLAGMFLGLFSESTKSFCYKAACIAVLIAFWRYWVKKRIIHDYEVKQEEIEKERIKRKEALEEREKLLRSAFMNTLENIPVVPVTISNEKISNGKLTEMQSKVEITKPDLKQPYDFSDFVAIDIETTGTVVTKSRIVEVSAIRFTNFRPTSAFVTLIDPQVPIPPEATKINNITDSMVAGKPTFKSIVPALSEFIGTSDLLGHNLMFDLKFLYKYGYDFTQCQRKYYDTCEMAKDVLVRFDSREAKKDFTYYFGGYDVYNYKLSTLCSHYDIFYDAHRAMADALATANLFRNMLIKEYKFPPGKGIYITVSESLNVVVALSELGGSGTDRIISFDDLFSDDFISKTADCSTLDEFLSSLGDMSPEQFMMTDVSELDRIVKQRTRYRDWTEYLKTAFNYYKKIQSY
ncbi:MAG: 3'-5' exonuclease [Ruminococcus sp.]|nr:3'-5' exonuclease [Ruminococcus sp.]